MMNLKTNIAKTSSTSSPVDRNMSTVLRMIMLLSRCCLLLMLLQHVQKIPSISAFSPLFTASSAPSKSMKKQYSITMFAKKKLKKSKNKAEDHSRWLSWMSSGSLSKTRHADEVRMREAEELGGVARSERYASRLVFRNALFEIGLAFS